MSQATLLTNAESAEQPSAVPPDEFGYKPVPVIAPVACFLGLICIVALFTELALPFCIFAMVLAFLAMRKIRRSEGELGGMVWAKIGLVSAAVFFVVSTASVVYAYTHEVPEGYTRVDFTRDISARQFVNEHGKRRLHPEVAKLDGQKIFIKGYMWKTKRQVGLDDFVFLKDNGKCCFGGNPKPYDMMIVKMKKGTTDAMGGLISVAGTLRCNPDSKGAVYTLEAVLVEPARTRY